MAKGGTTVTQTPLHELVRRPVIVFLDTETTGVDVRSSRILEVAAIRWDRSGRTTFEALMDPGANVTIPKQASDKNHITRERLISENARPSADVLKELDAFLQGADLLVAHNASFDLGILVHEYERLGLAPLRYEFMCTQAMAYLTETGVRRPNRGGYMMLGTKLEEVTECLGLGLKDAHHAMADVAMTESVFPRLLERARKQGLDVLNLLTHPQWLVKAGKAQPDYVPPGGRVEVVA